jgi:predicted enzyme related to lactoylglutathione lyase
MTTTGIKTVLYSVKDIERAKVLYGKLAGAPPTTDAPYYVGYDIAGQQVGLVPDGQGQGPRGPVGYWHVDDIKATIASLRGSGAELREDAHDVGAGRLVATLADPDGNVIGLIQG